MPSDIEIEREQCALLADQTVHELEGMRSGARKGHYDKQSGLQVDYAARWCRRIAERIRARSPAPEEELTAMPRIREACMLLAELRTVVQSTRPSTWRTETLARIDDLISPATDQSTRSP